MKQKHWIVAWVGGLASLAAQAGITQAPDMPTQAVLTWPFVDAALGDNLGPPVTFEYELLPIGHARVDALTWTADVAEVSGNLLRLGGDDTGLTVIKTTPLGRFTSTWQDLTIDLARQIVTGDEFVNGARVSNDVQVLQLLSAGAPEGRSVVLLGVGAGTLSLVSAVPEASSGLSMALGLLAMGWTSSRRRRRQR